MTFSTVIAALCILGLFAGEMALTIQGVTNQANMQSLGDTGIPRPADPAPPAGWLCLNHDELRYSATGRFNFFGANHSVIVAKIDGCDIASFSLYRGSELLREFTISPGEDLCESELLDEDEWPLEGPVSGTNLEYTIEMDLTTKNYFQYLAVLPHILTQGNGTLETECIIPAYPQDVKVQGVLGAKVIEMPFWGAGFLHFMFDGNFSITDFAAQIIPEGDDTPFVFKRNNYPDSKDYPMNFSDYVQMQQGGTFLQWDVNLPAGLHTLQMQCDIVGGVGYLSWLGLTDADSDLDDLQDSAEAQMGLNMTEPDVWEMLLGDLWLRFLMKIRLVLESSIQILV